MAETSAGPAADKLTFQDIIMNLQHYWAKQGCVVMQPYDSEVGAGTFHTATTPGAPAIRSRAAARPTAATVRTQTACSTTTSSRSS